jgi:hypothetical protein
MLISSKPSKSIFWRNAMKLWLVGALFFLGACKTTTNSSDPTHFFEQSRRRAPTDAEQANILNMNGCTAFFLKNTTDKLYAMSARHCLGNIPPEDWCGFAPLLRTEDDLHFRCKHIVATQPDRDLMIFEVEYSGENNPDRLVEIKESGYTLAAFEPELEARLLMIGYPADKFNSGKILVTENCWILQSTRPSPYPDMIDLSASHNCTTYGGNSGGPMILEGTEIVIGLPFTYTRDDYLQRDATNPSRTGSLALTSEFVSLFASELAEAGIVLASSGNFNKQPGNYLPAGRYFSEQQQGWYVIPLFKSGEVLESVKIENYTDPDMPGLVVPVTFPCSAEGCKAKGQTIKNIGKRSFTFVDKQGVETVLYFNGQKVDDVPENVKSEFFAWDAGEPNNNQGNQDCAIVKASGLWGDVECDKKKKHACRSTDDPLKWKLTSSKKQFSKGRCPSGYKFARPANEAETNALKDLIDDTAWINFTDRDSEGTFVEIP